MNRIELKKRFDELLEDYQPQQEIERLYQKAITIGILGIEEAEDKLTLPKIIWYAILLKMTKDCAPLHPENRKKAEDVLLFL